MMIPFALQKESKTTKIITLNEKSKQASCDAKQEILQQICCVFFTNHSSEEIISIEHRISKMF